MDAYTISLISQGFAVAITLLGLWLTGHKSIWAPILGIANLIPWMVFAVSVHGWLLIPMNLVIAWLHYRNYRLWRTNG